MMIKKLFLTSKHMFCMLSSSFTDCSAILLVLSVVPFVVRSNISDPRAPQICEGTSSGPGLLNYIPVLENGDSLFHYCNYLPAL